MSVATAGIEIKVLPDPVYHQHHQRRFKFGSVNTDMEKMYSRLLKETDKMAKTGIPLVNTDVNWGLKELELKEQYL